VFAAFFLRNNPFYKELAMGNEQVTIQQKLSVTFLSQEFENERILLLT
jgi:hypothetical protein